MKLIGIKGNSMLGERWSDSFSLSWFLYGSICLCLCDNKFIIRLLTILPLQRRFFFFLFEISTLTLPDEKFTLLIAEQN